MKINIFSQTDVGKERANNEDAFAYCVDASNPQWDISCVKGELVTVGSLGAISIVADGMGGANAGEVASGLAISTFREVFQDRTLLPTLKSDSDIHAFLTSTIEKVNEAILRHLDIDPDAFGLGTTIVVAWILKEKVYVAWCGDSRCYRFNPNSGLELLTKDHSYVQELIDQKEIKKEEALNHPDGHLITRCLGDVDASSVPEIRAFDIHDGDMFLLCSDGLCGYCSDSIIEHLLYQTYKEIDVCCNKLVNLALDSGGYDNVTVSIVSTLPDRAVEPLLSWRGKIRKWLHR